MHVPSFSANGCARLFWGALTRRIAPVPKRSKQVSILEQIPHNGEPVWGEWRGLACSDFSLQTQERSDSHQELLRWQRIIETDSLVTVTVRMRKNV